MGLPVRLRVWPARWVDLPDGRPVTTIRPGRVDWFVDGGELNSQLLIPLGQIGTHVSNRVTIREKPANEPWGDLAVVREDISPGEMAGAWTIGPAGIYLPVPRAMMTARLVNDIIVSCIEQMRWREYPSDPQEGACRT